MSSKDGYYLPHRATWPWIGTAGLAIMLAGFANVLNNSVIGKPMMIIGFATVIIMMVGWFTLQSIESESGMYNPQVSISYRLGMMWFIFSEVMFFAVFFGALYYIRDLSVDWLAGVGDGPGRSTNMLWEGYQSTWPTNGPGNVGGDYEPMGAFGLPLLNTLILLSSGVTVTWAHWGLIIKDRQQLIRGLIATVVLGFLFVFFQGIEYHDAYTEMGLTLGSGVYGSTFFMLTGFHGLHVTIGAIMLTVVLFRSWKGHFTPDNHFVFEAAAWYWHFVDVVWLGLFIFVYLF